MFYFCSKIYQKASDCYWQVGCGGYVVLELPVFSKG